MSWNLTTEAKAIAKAGVHANSTITASGSLLASFSDDAEAWVEAQTNRSWVTNIASVDAQVLLALSEVTSSLVAQRIIAYDTTGYIAREADILLNLNDAQIKSSIKVLKEMNSNSLKSP